MPVEVPLLADAPLPFGRCPRCDRVFEPFMRGEVQRSERPWWLLWQPRDYCALICRDCKRVVGWERPSQASIQRLLVKARRYAQSYSEPGAIRALVEMDKTSTPFPEPPSAPEGTEP